MLTKQDLTLLRVWAEGNRKALEWSVQKDGKERTFQINGLRGCEGWWERFFPPFPANSYSRAVNAEEILQALKDATTPLAFWRNETDRVWFPNALAALEAAKAWCGQR